MLSSSSSSCPSSSSNSSSRTSSSGGKISFVHVGVLAAFVWAILVQTAPGTTGPSAIPPQSTTTSSSSLSSIITSDYGESSVVLDPGTVVFVSTKDNNGGGDEKRSSTISTNDDSVDKKKKKMFQMTTIRFVGGDRRTILTGQLYLPHSSSPPPETGSNGFPVIVMAHGLGLVQDSHPIEDFRRAFVERGKYAVFTFDYATFGRSDGFPRHMVRPYRHVQDIEAAIMMLTSSRQCTTSSSSSQDDEGSTTIEGLRNQIDQSRVGLWGTSLAGGHQVVVASNAEQKIRRKLQQQTATTSTGSAETEEPTARIKAVVSLVPHLASGVESVLEAFIDPPRFLHTLQGILNFLHFLIKWSVWQFVSSSSDPWYIPFAGLPGSCSMMQNDGDLEGYTRLQSPQTEEYWWQNAADGWSAFHVLFYRPLNHIHELVQTPTLFIASQNDTLCPSSHVERAVSMSTSNNMESRIINDKGHFDVYSGRPLEEIINATLDFYNRHLMTP